LEVIAGADENDSTVSRKPVSDYFSIATTKPVGKVAVLKEAFSESIQPEIRAALQTAISSLVAQGYEVGQVEFPLAKYLLPTYYILTMAEASANLSRYDGVRYGYRAQGVHELDVFYKKNRSEGFGAEVKRRIMMGNFVLSASYYDAYFTKAQRVRRLIKEATDRILAEYAILLSPIAPTTAFPIGSQPEDPVSAYLADIFTVQANVCGLPAYAFPYGKDESNMPIGLQVMGNAFSEGQLLAWANLLGKA
jgi:aspartyl-tRNA(Asn)/glutamyl-tRNA(Gln) amidotransferase subunit A